MSFSPSLCGVLGHQIGQHNANELLDSVAEARAEADQANAQLWRMADMIGHLTARVESLETKVGQYAESIADLSSRIAWLVANSHCEQDCHASDD